LTKQQAATVVRHFRRAVEQESTSPLFRLNLAEALFWSGQRDEALSECRQALAQTSDTLSPAEIDAGHFPPAYNLFRVEWERAAWKSAGCMEREHRLKLRLVRWRLLELIGELSGTASDYRRAVRIRPDLWTTRAALGRLLLEQRDYRRSIPHLRRALGENPFDSTLARDLGVALAAAGDPSSIEELQTERRLLNRAAPGIDVEIRFSRPPAATNERHQHA
jgi:tetratricopeptide (TPR) repeat protein